MSKPLGKQKRGSTAGPSAGRPSVSIPLSQSQGLRLSLNLDDVIKGRHVEVIEKVEEEVQEEKPEEVDLGENEEIREAVEYVESLLQSPHVPINAHGCGKVCYIIHRFFYIEYLVTISLELFLRVFMWPHPARHLLCGLLSPIDVRFLVKAFPKLLRTHHTSPKLIGYIIGTMGCIADLDARVYHENEQLVFHVTLFCLRYIKTECVMLNSLLFIQRLCAPEIVNYFHSDKMMKKRACWLRLPEETCNVAPSPSRRYPPFRLNRSINVEGQWLAQDEKRNLSAKMNRQNKNKGKRGSFSDHPNSDSGDGAIGFDPRFSYNDDDRPGYDPRASFSGNSFDPRHSVGDAVQDLLDSGDDPNRGDDIVEPSWPVAFNPHKVLWEVYKQQGILATQLCGELYRDTVRHFQLGYKVPPFQMPRKDGEDDELPLLSNVSMVETKSEKSKDVRQTIIVPAKQEDMGAAIGRAQVGSRKTVMGKASSASRKTLSPVVKMSSKQPTSSTTPLKGRSKELAPEAHSFGGKEAIPISTIPSGSKAAKPKKLVMPKSRLATFREPAKVTQSNVYAHASNGKSTGDSDDDDSESTKRNSRMSVISESTGLRMSNKDNTRDDVISPGGGAVMKKSSLRHPGMAKGESPAGKALNFGFGNDDEPVSAEKVIAFANFVDTDDYGSDTQRGALNQKGQMLHRSSTTSSMGSRDIGRLTPLQRAMMRDDAHGGRSSTRSSISAQGAKIEETLEPEHFFGRDYFGRMRGDTYLKNQILLFGAGVMDVLFYVLHHMSHTVTPKRVEKEVPPAASAEVANLVKEETKGPEDAAEGVDPTDESSHEHPSEPMKQGSKTCTDSKVGAVSKEKTIEKALVEHEKAKFAKAQDSLAEDEKLDKLRKGKPKPAFFHKNARRTGMNRRKSVEKSNSAVGDVDDEEEEDDYDQEESEDNKNEEKQAGEADGDEEQKGNEETQPSQPLEDWDPTPPPRPPIPPSKLRLVRQMEMQKENRDADLLLLALHVTYLLIRGNPHNLRRFCRADDWVAGKPILIDEKLGRSTVMVPSTTLKSMKSSETFAAIERSIAAKSQAMGKSMAVKSMANKSMAAKSMAPLQDANKTGRKTMHGKSKGKKSIHGKLHQDYLDNLDPDELTPQQLFERNKRNKLCKVENVSPVQRASVILLGRLLKGRCARDRKEVSILLLRIIHMVVSYWLQSNEVGPWLELVGVIQDTVAVFHDSTEVQLEGGSALGLIMKMSRINQPRWKVSTGLRVPVLANIRRTLEQGVANTLSVLERQERLGKTAEVVEDIICFSPRMLNHSRQVIHNCDEMLLEAMADKDRARQKRLREEMAKREDELKKTHAKKAAQKMKSEDLMAMVKAATKRMEDAKNAMESQRKAAAAGKSATDDKVSEEAQAAFEAAQKEAEELQQELAEAAATHDEDGEEGPERFAPEGAAGLHSTGGAQPVPSEKEEVKSLIPERKQGQPPVIWSPQEHARRLVADCASYRARLGDPELAPDKAFEMFLPNIKNSVSMLTECCGSDPIIKMKKQDHKALKVRIYFRCGENKMMKKYIPLYKAKSNIDKVTQMFAIGVKNNGYELPAKGLNLRVHGDANIQHEDEERIALRKKAAKAGKNIERTLLEADVEYTDDSDDDDAQDGLVEWVESVDEDGNIIQVPARKKKLRKTKTALEDLLQDLDHIENEHGEKEALQSLDLEEHASLGKHMRKSTAKRGPLKPQDESTEMDDFSPSKYASSDEEDEAGGATTGGKGGAVQSVRQPPGTGAGHGGGGPRRPSLTVPSPRPGKDFTDVRPQSILKMKSHYGANAEADDATSPDGLSIGKLPRIESSRSGLA